MKKLFINKDIKVIKGIKAEKLLGKKNDSIYIENNAILKVDKNRWFEAQHYEKKTWMNKGINSSDDRNFEHLTRFDSYKSLTEINANYSLIKVIELGCGPFTNMRTMIPYLPKLEEIHLLDPLINDYLTHPNCQYKGGRLGKYKTKLHAISIEDSEISAKFDLVMMINVLEHCYNIYNIFDQIIKLLAVGGIFIFSDVYFIEQDISTIVFDIYDAGHPIKLSDVFMNKFLLNFNKIFEKDFHGLYEQNWRHDKYFIGQKK